MQDKNKSTQNVGPSKASLLSAARIFTYAVSLIVRHLANSIRHVNTHFHHFRSHNLNGPFSATRGEANSALSVAMSPVSGRLESRPHCLPFSTFSSKRFQTKQNVFFFFWTTARLSSKVCKFDGMLRRLVILRLPNSSPAPASFTAWNTRTAFCAPQRGARPPRPPRWGRQAISDGA